MKQQYSLALLPLLILAGCNGEEQSVESTSSGYLSYSYPTDGQSGVSPEADVVMRFSHAITDEEADSKIQLMKDGQEVGYSLKKVDGDRSLVLSPDDGLEAKAEYTVTFADPLSGADGVSFDTPNAEGEPGIQFATRTLFDGPNNQVEASDSFEVASTVPLPDSQKNQPGDFGTMNFSTFRLKTTHPVHPQWQDQGGSVELTDSSGEPVDAKVIIRGNSITVDPCVTETLAGCGSKEDVLEAGETYTLSLDNLPSKTNGDQTLSQEFKYTPRDTAPTVVAEQVNVDSGLASGESQEQATRSVLNGQIINGVTLNSVLQGVTDTSQQTGSLFAELGYAPSFGSDEPLPLRIPRNSVLRSTSIDVKVGGKVPILKALPDGEFGEQETTGDIKVTMISDATGYLSPNPYTDNDSAPRHVTLFMDIAMNTESEQPNAALSQDLMGVELRGIALVRDGVLTIDAIGVVEPELLGQEYTDSTIAFNLEADLSEDAPTDAAELRPEDNEPPELISWTPGPEDAVPDTRQDMQRPGDPVTLNFNEPIDGDSVEEGITLFADGSAIEALNTKVDGTTVTINPEDGLKHNVDYKLNINNQLTDLAGNGTGIEPLMFSLPSTPESNSDLIPERPPLALTTYPGFPCETDHSNMNLTEGVLGQCFDDSDEAYDTNTEIVRDMLPVSTMPADRPITVVFSQSMNLESIRLGETFIVEKVEANADGKPVTEVGEGELVSGRLEKNNQRIRFYPDESWEEGSFYRYTMASNADPNPDTCTENPPKAVCGANDLALKTDLLEGLDDGDGANGEDPLVIYFEGAEPKETVFTPLRNLPIRDTNSNFLIDCNPSENSDGNREFDNDNNDCLEPFEASHQGSDEGGWEPAANSTKLRIRGNETKGGSPARVGCPTRETCPRDKFIHQTYALNTEVKGPGTYDPTPADPNSGDEVEGIRVHLYPTALATSSISVFVDATSLGIGEQESVTNTQVLRMRYAKDDPTCSSDCERSSLIPGVITTGDDGQPVFRTRVELLLDAPDMLIPLSGSHDLYGRPFTLELKGDITFFDDGRMQVEQWNTNLVGENDELLVTANAGGLVTLELPLEIPKDGAYLNFISNPVKDLPGELRQTTSEQ
ncbi:Ig-like domain-containing protein [Halospina denitrificans]|uniref:Ig-like domain-containing protein n=1 Tax=Halospina denitrificans TaxID=332522 RepID=A0A4R7JXI1_9GAMM|nr:Ig-like domain-containing protein [Halospina denitrificans]TDT43181.1 Ig-like domain-containing protein [Halospina denitrificans]